MFLSEPFRKRLVELLGRNSGVETGVETTFIMKSTEESLRVRFLVSFVHTLDKLMQYAAYGSMINFT